MDIKVVDGDIARQSLPAVVVNLFQGVTEPGGATGAVDSALDGAISQLIADGEIRGKRGETTLIHTLGKIAPARVLVAGLGNKSDFSQETVRDVTAQACRRLREVGVSTAATIAHGAGVGGMDAGAAGQAVTEGALLGLYRFDKYKSVDDGPALDELVIVEFDADKVGDIRSGVQKGVLLAEAANLCRDMVNEPANQMNPTRMSEIARDVASECGLEIDVLDADRMRELGMGALLGVAQGSVEPPKLIVLDYRGDPENAANNLGLIGKGITFDSGGISIKPAANMGAMKGDMAGGASVIAAIKAISRLAPKINVTAMVAATENMPGGRAQRPGDIVTVMNGKTIEIDNTDAEGRLVLADAVSYARTMGIERIVDVATLTGAIITALGDVATGAFGSDQPLIDAVLEAGNAVGERIWQFPTYDDYREQYKSDVADFKNTGGRAAGSITGAQLIGEFATGAAWVHLDIAGTSKMDKLKGYNPKGATGVPVRTLVRLAEDLAAGD